MASKLMFGLKTGLLAALVVTSLAQAQGKRGGGRGRLDPEAISPTASRAQVGVLPAAQMGASGLTIYGAPAGNVIFRQRKQPLDDLFKIEAPNFDTGEIFSEEFTTAPSSTYLEINYSCQPKIYDDPAQASATNYDGVMFTCCVYQWNGTNWGTAMRFPGWEYDPYLIAHDSNGRGGISVCTLHSIMPIEPSKLTKVVVSMSTWRTRANVLPNLMTLRY